MISCAVYSYHLANLAFLARHHIEPAMIEYTRLEVLLIKNTSTDDWQLVLLYNDEVVVRGGPGQRDTVLEMMLEAAAEAVATYLDD
jgi:hypothetical protein